ncbi:hypothetical protein AB0J80_27710 [Actinoplanes sp. NPDC049548]|uniref:hypothetical protein n=1 Tax=Actinoplanes sp. NPDC049548 TaxID=3155152 RepID=UPI003446EDCF
MAISTAHPSSRRRRLVVLAASACAALAVWIVVLAQHLPARYVVHRWNAAWIGFDVLLLCSFAAVGYTAWRRAALLPLAAQTSAVLLLCDAWFDVMTAAGTPDLLIGLACAAVEVPLALMLGRVALRRHT